MADAVAKEGQYVSDRDALSGGKSAVELWLAKIDAAKEEEKDWRESARLAAATYEAAKDQKSAFNIYHANVEVIVPALYNSTPLADVRRRHEPEQVDEQAFAGLPPEQAQMAMQQAQQQAAGQAKVFKSVADLTERALAYAVDQYEFDATMQDVVRDAAVTGRGVVRVRHVPQFADGLVAYEKVVCERVVWDRFIRGPGLLWSSVPFVAFEHDLTREEIAKISDDAEQVKALGFPHARDDGTDAGAERERDLKHKGVLKTVKVYEIWDKASRKTLFVSPQDKARPLAVIEDVLGLDEFFPVPRPLQTLRRLSSLTPICPYDVYAPQIEELASISRRIMALIGQLRVRGVYDPKMMPDFEMLRDADDGQYIPSSGSEQFVAGQRNGLEDSVLHWPIDKIIQVLAALYEEREQAKQTIYEIMGIADILRGSVDPNEKLGQSEIKAQAGSQRLQRSQSEVARVARDLFRMKASIIHQQFRPETIALMTGIQVTPAIQEVLHGQMRTYSIDIESDSTIRADMARNQEQLNMFLQGAAQIAQAATAMAPVMPAVIPAFFAVFGSFGRNFKLGKQGEDALDAMVEAAKQPPVQEDNGAEAAAAEQQARQQEADMKMQIEERKDAREERKLAGDLELKQMDMRLKELEIQMKMLEMESARETAAIDIEAKKLDIDAKREGSAIDADGKRQDIDHKRELAEIKAAQARKPNGADAR
jgi:hypothetical protein